MFLSSVTRAALVLACSGLILSGCDREPAGQAQEQGGDPANATDKSPANGANGVGANGQIVTGEIDRSRAGELLPAMNVEDLDGKKLNLGALSGKPVLLNLWATYCAPCKVEMPMLDQLADDLGDDVRLLTVSQDLKGAELVGPYFASMKFRNLESWMETKGQLGFALGSASLPVTILYDSSGKEVWRVTGEYDWSSAAAREAVLADSGAD